MIGYQIPALLTQRSRGFYCIMLKDNDALTFRKVSAGKQCTNGVVSFCEYHLTITELKILHAGGYIMKRTGWMALAFSLIVVTAACGEEESPEEAPPENPEVEDEA